MKTFSAYFEVRGTAGNMLFWFLVVAACVAAFGLLIGPPFRESTGGVDAIDLQFPLNAEIIYSQLASYTEETKRLYVWFAVVDYVFPPAMAMFMALLWAWLFAKAPNGVYTFLVGAGVFALPFVVALLDWLENVGFLFHRVQLSDETATGHRGQHNHSPSKSDAHRHQHIADSAVCSFDLIPCLAPKQHGVGMRFLIS